MLWRSSLALAALLLVPGLAGFLVWSGRRRARDLDCFVATALIPAVAPDWNPRRRRLRHGLRLGAIGALIVALAGPMWGFRWQEVRREGIDLILAVDTSRSMLATDVKPNRLARAKLAIQDLLAQLAGDRVGLVAFAGTAFLQCPLTLDYGAFAQSLDAIDAGIIPRGGTSLSAAIDTALAGFEGREGTNQALVLITDGEDHEGAVAEATKRAAERGVKVYTVGVGTAEGELIPSEGGGYLKDRSGQVVKSRLGEETLQRIATDTGGVYLQATGASFGLPELYRDHIGALEKRELATTLERRYEHRFQFPLALALLLLVAEELVGERRPPGTAAARRRRVFALPRRVRVPAAAMLLAVVTIGWLDPHAPIREGNRLYDAGKFDEAVAKYNEALIDRPGSAPLHFALGDATYKLGKYSEALTAFEQAGSDDGDLGRRARVAYNVGNTKYRLAEDAAAKEPQRALGLYAEALVAYRRALGAAPDDEDAKFNYELTAKKRKELEQRLEEERKKAEENAQQQQDDQNAEQQPGEEEQKPDQQPQNEQAQDEKPPEAEQPSPEKEQQQAESGAPPNEEERQEEKTGQPEAENEPAPQEEAATEEQGGGAAAAAGEKAEGELSRQEAAALLDAQRGEEVQPEEIVKRLQGAVVAEPAQDW